MNIDMTSTFVSIAQERERKAFLSDELGHVRGTKVYCQQRQNLKKVVNQLRAGGFSPYPDDNGGGSHCELIYTIRRSEYPGAYHRRKWASCNQNKQKRLNNAQSIKQDGME